MQKHPWHIAIEELYHLERGFLIPNPDLCLPLALDVCISKRALKHVIESRKANGYSPERIYEMLGDIVDAFTDPDLDVPNRKGAYENSRICGKAFEASGRYLLVIYEKSGEDRFVITAFYTSKRRLARLGT